MSSESIVALIAVIVSGIVGLASVGLNHWNVRGERQSRLDDRREDNREWYKRTLFEKRLAAAQDAFTWWTRFNDAISAAGRAGGPGSDARRKVEVLSREAREWYDTHSLYLDGAFTSRSEFVGLINTAFVWAGGRTDVNIQESLRDSNTFLKTLSNRLLSAETAMVMTPND